LERLIRYTARGAVSLARLAYDTNGDLVYTFTHPWSDGTTGIRLSPLELVEKLAALVPLPRVHSPAARPALKQSLARCVCCLSLRVRPVTRSPACPEARPAAAAYLLPVYCLRGSPAADAPARRGMAPDGAGSLRHALAGRSP